MIPRVYTQASKYTLDEPSHILFVPFCFQWISWPHSFPVQTIAGPLFWCVFQGEGERVRDKKAARLGG
jgi:hypothetical protein